MEHRSGLMVEAVVTHDEPAAALVMLDSLAGKQASTIASDKADDTRDFVQACCESTCS